METVVFDINELTKRDQYIYENMSENEKKQYEKLWETMKTKELKLQQLQNASKDRVQREKKALSEKERKERNHRLIERGAIVESLIPNSTKLSNSQIKEILIKALKETQDNTLNQSIPNNPFD